MSDTKISEVDLRRLAALVKTKRAGRPYREAAKEADVAPATVLRIEREEPIDLERFARICRWLKISPELVFTQPTPKRDMPRSGDFVFTSSLNMSQKIETALRFEGKMRDEEIAAVTNLVKLAYERGESVPVRKKTTN